MPSRRPLALTALVALCGALICSAASADPKGRSTLTETIRLQGSGAFPALVSGPGERYVVRQGDLGDARSGRAGRRRSLLLFAQLTDPQIADEMSPARVELLDPAGSLLSAAWRPQEAMGTYVFDQTVRNINRNRTSPVRQGDGRRRGLDFAITTGDLADNQQLNESRWFIDVLRGGRIDPFSGVRPASGQCQGDAQTLDQLRRAVDQRRYTGVQDYGDYPGVPFSLYQGFWDPDTPPPGGGPYAAFPRYPGLMAGAQRRFTAEGLRVPWFTSRGNHDGLLQGTVTATPVFRSIAVGCLKRFPSATPFNLADPQVGALPVPPDPARRFVTKEQYKRLHGTGVAQGYGFVTPGQNAASGGTASYYSFSPKPGFRFVALDTVAEGGGADGNLDDPQYRWLARVLDRNSSFEVTSSGSVVRDSDPDRLIVVYGHHTLATMGNATADEQAGCSDPDVAGCDGDPRDSRPIHMGQTGDATVRDLLLRYPNVIALVDGHTHANRLAAVGREDGIGGFWEINTSSHVDFPQQSRLLEVMDNRDGTLSLFGTMLDTAAPIRTPAAGRKASSFSSAQLASVSRLLAANDPQYGGVTEGRGTGQRIDRNAELLLRDPRRMWRAPRACPRGVPQAQAAC